MSIMTTANAAVILAQSGTGGTTDGGGESWDLESFLENATSSGETIGGLLLSLMGLIGVVWGGVLLVKKLLSDQSRESWIKIIALIIVGGALLYGGISLVLNFARGGKDTIEDFGNNGGGGVVAMHQVIDDPTGGSLTLPDGTALGWSAA